MRTERALPRIAALESGDRVEPRNGAPALGSGLALFVDVPNSHPSAGALGFGNDDRNPEPSSAEGRPVRAFYYTAPAEDPEYSPLRPLLDWLRYNGDAVATEPAQKVSDAMGNRRVRRNMDVGIAVDATETGKRVDRIVPCSGDGDFRRPVEAVRREAVRVGVASTPRPSPPPAADEPRRLADFFIDLQDLAPEIARAARPAETRMPTPAPPGPGVAHAG